MNPKVLPLKGQCVHDMVMYPKKRQRDEPSFHAGIQTPSLSDPSRLRRQQRSDFTCTFCAEVYLKSWVYYPRATCVI